MLRSIWFNRKLRAWCLQGLIALAFVGALAWLIANARDNLTRRGITVGFGFLEQTARFPISESLIGYSTEDTFGKAFLVGLTNTLFISLLVIGISTILGLVLALARRSSHPLLKGVATAYVEVVRNIPLVVQLLFWYGLVTINLPNARNALSPLPGVFFSLRGLFIPRPVFSGEVAFFWGAVAIGLILIAAMRVLQKRSRRLAGSRLPLLRLALVIAFLISIIGWWVGGVSAKWEMPALQGFNFIGGTSFTPEFLALIVGLVIYSASFVGEVIRGGIDAVAKGQWEAGDALGLSRQRTLRLIVFPQALRVIVPPMTSQYLSIIKNSTLALAVGYPDLSFVVATTINQTGQAIEGILILMGVFLLISVMISIFMNWYNRRVGLAQR